MGCYKPSSQNRPMDLRDLLPVSSLEAQALLSERNQCQIRQSEALAVLASFCPSLLLSKKKPPEPVGHLHPSVETPAFWLVPDEIFNG